jgi:acyl-coenzyme A synthetase/AMP-(fatty) acid ligase
VTDVFGHHRLEIPYTPIADLLAQYRRRGPDKPAIVDVDRGRSISFGALDRAVTDIAAALKDRGVAKGSRVLLLAEENFEKLLLWLGAWRIGAVIVPLDIELNAAFVGDLAAAASPAITLVHKELDGAALLGERPFVRFGNYSGNAADADPQDDFFRVMTRDVAAESLPERNEPADIAGIVCTSGTTSRPKVIVYDHCFYWLNGLSILECLGVGADDRMLEYRSFGWNSAQVLSLMPFLQKGLTLHIARRFSHSRFFEWITRYGITFAAGVPTVINMLLNKPLGYGSRDVPTLRLMSCSSAPLAPEQWQRFEEMYGIKLLQMYGMSEGGWLCGNRQYKCKMGTVGLAALHQELEIVDAEGKPCPPGVGGEVTAGGPHCAIGYLRADGTIEPIRGKRIRSGDLAIMDEEGFIRVVGRTKDLIIRGGVNIAPAEIDELLLKHAAILDAAAVGVPDAIYGEEVVCYVVPRPESGLSAAAVIAHCQASLPAAKVPKQVIMVADLPKNDRGKVLRDRLREDWCERAKQSEQRHSGAPPISALAEIGNTSAKVG